MKQVIIGTCDEFTKEIIRHCVHAVNPTLQIIDGSNDTDIIYHLKSAEDDIVFFDKFFLSYVLKFKIKALRVYNNKLRIVFCEQGNCSTYFGLRIHKLNADGFISNIENTKEFTKVMREVLGGVTYYPDDVKTSLNKNVHLLSPKYCSEVTEVELEIGMYLGQGKSVKEISTLTNMQMPTVSAHINRLKHKIGYDCMNDFAVLNRQLEKINYRSWNC